MVFFEKCENICIFASNYKILFVIIKPWVVMTHQAETIELSCAYDMLQTEEMIDFIKTRYEKLLAKELNLVKVSAPVVVPDGTGINDDQIGRAHV